MGQRLRNTLSELKVTELKEKKYFRKTTKDRVLISHIKEEKVSLSLMTSSALRYFGIIRKIGKLFDLRVFQTRQLQGNANFLIEIILVGYEKDLKIAKLFLEKIVRATEFDLITKRNVLIKDKKKYTTHMKDRLTKYRSTMNDKAFEWLRDRIKSKSRLKKKGIIGYTHSLDRRLAINRYIDNNLRAMHLKKELKYADNPE